MRARQRRSTFIETTAGLALVVGSLVGCSGVKVAAFEGTWDFETVPETGEPIRVNDVEVDSDGTFDTGDVEGRRLAGGIVIRIASSSKPGELSGTLTETATPDEEIRFNGTCSTVQCIGNSDVGPMTFTKQ